VGEHDSSVKVSTYMGGVLPFGMKCMSDAETASMFPPAHFPFLVGWRGSIAHNMYLPPSDPMGVDDKDVMAVTVAPLEFYYGLSQHEGSETWVGNYDVVTYDIRKYVRLCVKANPNVLSLLWLRPEHYIYASELGKELVGMRDLFMTKKLFHSFTGYAYAQLKKMTHQTYGGYMGEKRKRLVDEYGYDTKNAAHLVRLLRMGIEALNEGVLHVFREDAPQLIEIKKGGWSLERVQDEAKHLFRRAEEAYDRSTLPQSANVDAINQRLVHAMLEHFRGKAY